MLIFRIEKEYQPASQYSIEGATKHFRILNGFAEDGYAGQVALECNHERGRSIDREHLKPFLDQYSRDREARATAQIDNAAPGRQRPGPHPHLLRADSD